ncbi:MAG: hypothetical protein SF162_06765 [bacterium]|nr:hypothetical protein [bacterium]
MRIHGLPLLLIALIGQSSLFAGALIVMGGARAAMPPDTVARAGFSQCSAPCLLTILPGETVWTAVADGGDDATFTLPPSGTISLYRSADGVKVGRMFAFLPPGIAFGWVTTYFGEPCGVSLYPRAELVTVRYPTVLANLSVESRQFTSFSPVISLQFIDPAGAGDVLREHCADHVTGYGVFNSQWHGISRLRDLLRRFGMID